MVAKKRHFTKTESCFFLSAAFFMQVAVAETLFKMSTNKSEFREVNDFETSNWIEKASSFNKSFDPHYPPELFISLL